MTQSDREPASCDDANLDALLRAFFAHEMPAALRELPAEVEPRSSSPTHHSTSRRPALVVLVVAATALAACALVAILPQPQRITKSASVASSTKDVAVNALVADGNGDRNDNAATHGPVAEVVAPDPLYSYAPLMLNFTGNDNYFLAEESTPVERLTYATANGQVEQNTFVNTTNGAFFDPATGQRIVFAFPEISIEVLNVAVPVTAAQPAAAAPPAKE